MPRRWCSTSLTVMVININVAPSNHEDNNFNYMLLHNFNVQQLDHNNEEYKYTVAQLRKDKLEVKHSNKLKENKHFSNVSCKQH